MLILRRATDEGVTIDLREFGRGLVKVRVCEIGHGVVRLGFAADERIPIDRDEVHDAKERDKRRGDAR